MKEKSDFCPGDLVITSRSSFFVYDQINILDADKYDLATATVFMMNNSQQTAQMKVSIIVSCPQVQHKLDSGSKSVYVIFPETIGWIRTYNIAETFGGLYDEQLHCD